MESENSGASALIELLKAHVNLIDVVTKRGAFEGQELLDVGTIRQQTILAVQQLTEANQRTQLSIAQDESTTADSDQVSEKVVEETLN